MKELAFHRWEPKSVLVVGATGGIGEEIVNGLDPLDPRLTLVCRSAKKAHEAFDTLRSDWEVVECDLTDLDAASSVGEALQSRQFDSIIVNSGIVEPLPTANATPDHMVSHYLVNAVAPMVLIRDSLANMHSGGGGRLVVNVSSASLAPLKNYGAYSGSKAAMRAQLQSLRQELHPSVTVSAIFLSGVRTSMLEKENESPFASPLNYLSDPVDAKAAAEVILQTLTSPNPRSEVYAPKSDAVLAKVMSSAPTATAPLLRKIESFAQRKMDRDRMAK